MGLLNVHKVPDILARKISEFLKIGYRFSGKSIQKSVSTRLRDRNVKKILSDKYEFIYMVNPLCGSRSIVRELRSNRDYNTYETRKEIRKMSREKIDTYLIFTVVRDPFERLISCYNKKILNCNSIGKLLLISQFDAIRPQMGFKEFVKVICETYKKDLESDPHWASQVSIIRRNIGIDNFNYLISLESLSEDLPSIFESHGIPSPNIRKLKTSKSMPKRPLYEEPKDYYSGISKDIKNKIRDRYKNDRALLEFESSNVLDHNKV